MPKKPPSAYKNKSVKKVRTVRDWITISIYLILALALVASTFAVMFIDTGTHSGF